MENAPFVISVGICRDPVEGDIILIDCDSIEIQCVDQILHIAVDKNNCIHGFEQSKSAQKKMIAGLPVQIFSSNDFSAILEEKILELTKVY